MLSALSFIYMLYARARAYTATYHKSLHCHFQSHINRMLAFDAIAHRYNLLLIVIIIFSAVF